MQEVSQELWRKLEAATTTEELRQVTIAFCMETGADAGFVLDLVNRVQRAVGEELADELSGIVNRVFWEEE